MPAASSHICYVFDSWLRLFHEGYSLINLMNPI